MDGVLDYYTGENNLTNAIKVKLLHDDAKPPQRQHADDIGLDVFVAEVEFLAPQAGSRFGELFALHLGIAVEPPPGYYVELVSRSSVYKYGLTMVNGVGIVDPGYRGPLKMIMAKCVNKPTMPAIGDRVGQLVLRKVHKCDVVCVEQLSETARGSGGFGSTGK